MDDDNNFFYYFLALGYYIKGFMQPIRQVITVDGSYLKDKYRVTLLIATYLDGNNQMYPIANGILDS